MEKIKAIGLFSGGLDSVLACRVLIEQGIAVIPVQFDTGFFFKMSDRKSHLEKKEPSATQTELIDMGDNIQIPLRKINIADKYLPLLLQPKFGYGKALNPCIDCHLFFIQQARKLMDQEKAHFIFTGEVVGQRPMSQHLQTLKRIEKNSGAEGLLLRPLSARLLPETQVEKNGWVDRERLLAIHGRSRKEQIALAEKFGIQQYQQPAGGCILTDESYGIRMKDLLDHKQDKEPSWDEIDLLSGGRIFRLSANTKIIVGRNEKDNLFLEKYAGRFPHMELGTELYGSPLTMIHGEINPDVLHLSARITITYSAAPKDQDVPVRLIQPGQPEQIITTSAIDKKKTRQWKIG